MMRDYLFDIAKIIEGAANSDLQKVSAYSQQLAQRLEGDGELEGAKRIRRALGNSKASILGLSKITPNGQPLPVDGESRLPIADEQKIDAGSVELFLSEENSRLTQQFLTFFRAASKLVANGVGISPSMLVYGPPGCGKTQLARYVASELGLPMITARMDSLISSYLGSTAKNLRQLFDHASSRPCVLFLDEFDALAKMRDDVHELGELKRVVISLLQNIDALGPDHVLLAATNHEHLLDPAIWRRFQYKMKLEQPDSCAREKMLRVFFGAFATPQIIDLVVSISDGMTGAQLKQAAEVCIRSAVLADENSLSAPETIRAVLAANPRTTAETIGSLPSQLKALRDLDKKKFTQARLADVFGISQTWVSKLLRDSA